MKDQPHIGESLFDETLLNLVARRNCCECSHFLGVIERQFLVIFESPWVTQPPGAVQLVPELLAVTLLAGEVPFETALKEFLP